MPFRSVICMWSFVDRPLLLEDGVTLTLTEGLRDSDLPSFPPSKYSIKSEVCDLFEDRLPRPSLPPFFRRVAMVTGLPSSGNVYWLFSVILEPISLPPLVVSVSVGAGRGGALRPSIPILTMRERKENEV